MKVYKRESYLEKIRGFYNDGEVIKVVTGIRRCGKSCFLQSIMGELLDNGVNEKDIIYIRLDVRPFKSIKSALELEKIIDEKIVDNDFKYLFIDEIQNVKGFEEVIDSYRAIGNMSIFITGSNSYLLSGELVTKLTGRKIEIEMFTLSFYEYIEMKKFLGKELDKNINIEFQNYVINGGFPGSVKYDNLSDREFYVREIINDIFSKDIKPNEKIRNLDTFKNVQNFIINNFGNVCSVSSIRKYFECQNIKISDATISRYINILVNAKIIYPCEMFDIKSRKVLKGERKYYLADTSIYYAMNTDNRINYGPVLENVIHNYLISKGYSLSVGRIGNFECDFIARKVDNYYYIQITKNIDDEKTEKREYRPFYMIKDMYPRYLFVMDIILQRNVNGINNVNIIDFMLENGDLC